MLPLLASVLASVLAGLFGDFATGSSRGRKAEEGAKPSQIGGNWPVDACRQSYSSAVGFRDITAPIGDKDCCVMDSQSLAGILGGIVAAIVLVVAFAYGPMGPFGKGKPTAAAPAAQTAPAAPAPRGPVIKDVPN